MEGSSIGPPLIHFDKPAICRALGSGQFTFSVRRKRIVSPLPYMAVFILDLYADVAPSMYDSSQYISQNLPAPLFTGLEDHKIV